MQFEQIFEKLLYFYGVHSVTDLAHALKMERSTLNSWKTRKSSGQLLAHLAENDPAALSAIFTSQNNHFGNVVGTGVSNGSGSTTINNNGSKIDLSGLDESMLVLFRDVYLKLEKFGELKKLHDLLGQLKWE